MRVAAFAAAVVWLGLAGCEAPEPAVAPMSHDEGRCAASGFKPGSAEMAGCIRTATEARTADRDRALARAEQIRQEQARLDAEWRTPPEDFVDATGDGLSADPLPTAESLPEMQCIGVGDEAVCIELTDDPTLADDPN